MKTCYTCKINKPKPDFSKHNQKKDGLDPNCKACRRVKARKYYQKDKEKIKERRLKYYYNNSEKCKESSLNWQRKKVKTDKFFKLKRRLRNRLYYALKKKYWKKNTHFSEYIGCDKKTLIAHLENQFIDGMSWDNYGQWHIDHIIPLNSANTDQELYKLCHYTNLQPLWGSDNIKKGDSIAESP